MDLGQPIGEESMLMREPSKFTVQAASDVLLLRMPAPKFSDLLLKRPDIVQHVQTLKRQHMRQTCSYVGR